jgi:hypothetical protein
VLLAKAGAIKPLLNATAAEGLRTLLLGVIKLTLARPITYDRIK